MKTLLTTDGSQSAEQAIRWFSRLPIAHSESYEILTVSDYQNYGMVPIEVHEELLRLESAHAIESFQRAEKILKEAGMGATQISCIGQPAYEITRHAKENQCDLIVVGAHGRSFLEHMLIGSISESVARHAPCSVLVVRKSKAKVAEGDPTHITVASDCSDSDRQIASQINAIHFPKNTKFNLISVIEHPFLIEPTIEYDAQLTRATTSSLDRLAMELSESSEYIQKVVLEKLHVSSCILNFVQTHPTDILVLGDKGRTAIGRFFLGSVSRVLLQHAPCSVLLVRKQQAQEIKRS